MVCTLEDMWSGEVEKIVYISDNGKGWEIHMGRKKGNTRERIMEEALMLFSANGFDGVSVKMIADAVGIGPSALYKHFKGKQEIFDSIVESSRENYMEHAAFRTAQIRGSEAVREMCLSMFAYQTKDPWIVAFRRLLLIEKFKNPDMAELYKKFFVDIPLDTQEKIFRELQSQGLMIAGNPRVFAMELYAPFFLYHTAAESREDILELLQCHVQNFYEENMVERQDK